MGWEITKVADTYFTEADSRPRLVVIESPFAGDVERNIRYARAAMLDSLLRGEAPFVSHMLYPREAGGPLYDSSPAERSLGIYAGFAWWDAAELVAFYADYGYSPGMQEALERAKNLGKPHVVRLLYTSNMVDKS